jgi:hypothetical protein
MQSIKELQLLGIDVSPFPIQSLFNLQVVLQKFQKTLLVEL